MLYGIDGEPAFRIDFYDNTVANKWQELIKSIYVGDGEDIDHKRTFFYLQSVEDVRNILLNAIANINNFLKTEFIKIPKKIDWEDQKLYNDLHHAFEKLSGEYDNPTRLMTVAPMPIKENVRDINFCVHALEHPSQNKSTDVLSIQWTKKRDTNTRLKLEAQEYDLIQFHKVRYEVYLAYNELGKSYIDLWKDKLHINYPALKNNHYIGPDINISFVNQENIFEDDFIKWCQNNNVDPFKKENGIGLIPIGKISDYLPQGLTKHSKLDIIEGLS